VDALRGLLGSRWGLSSILAGAAALVASGVVVHDAPEAQAAGTAGLALLALGAAALGPRVSAWLAARFGGGATKP
jgi:hypothetical protein